MYQLLRESSNNCNTAFFRAIENAHDFKHLSTSKPEFIRYLLQQVSSGFSNNQATSVKEIIEHLSKYFIAKNGLQEVFGENPRPISEAELMKSKHYIRLFERRDKSLIKHIESAVQAPGVTVFRAGVRHADQFRKKLIKKKNSPDELVIVARKSYYKK